MKKETKNKNIAVIVMSELYGEIQTLKFVRDIQQMELYADIDRLNQQRSINDAVGDIAPVF